MKVTSVEFIEKVKEIEEKLISEIKIEGKRESVIQAKTEIAKKEAHINAVFLAVKELVGQGEEVKTDDFTFYKKHKEARNNPERTVTLHGVTRTIEASVTPEKDVLGFKTKVEY